MPSHLLLKTSSSHFVSRPCNKLSMCLASSSSFSRHRGQIPFSNPLLVPLNYHIPAFSYAVPLLNYHFLYTNQRVPPYNIYVLFCDRIIFYRPIIFAQFFLRSSESLSWSKNKPAFYGTVHFHIHKGATH
jgi:hypothetical protein